MSSLMGSHGTMALATAMAVSGTVILFALCRQKPLSFSASASVSPNSPPPCISSDKRKVMKKSKNTNNKKRVRFAENIVVEFESSAAEEEKEKVPEISRRSSTAKSMPANRLALYNGMMQYKLQRMICSS